MKTLEKLGKEVPGRKPEEAKSIEGRHYNFESIKQLEKPIERIVNNLQEEIDKGDYDTLISDDASGRIPTLILRNIIKDRVDTLHPDLTPEEKRDALKTFFIAGGRTRTYAETNSQKLTEFFDKIKPKIKKRALFITEYIHTGGTIRRIGAILEKAGIPFDVVTISHGLDMDSLMEILPGEKLEVKPHIIGDKYVDEHYENKDHKLVMGRGGELYKEYEKFGVKRSSRSLKAHPIRYSRKEKDRPFVEKAREDVKTVAESVTKKVWSKE